ncbi:hypothetical protein AB0451_09215 [Streptomyces sp. NPDC052000]|uniref:hypothetical protein n=1 Tax=Streptomyces sp. NPDC052000 TaxID=3155676 RepID=UPI00344B6EAA
MSATPRSPRLKDPQRRLLPRTMATLRNLAIRVFRQDGRSNIAAACRHTARDPQRALTALGIT